MDESWPHEDISNEHNPLELGPSEGGLLRTMPEPGTLHTIVIIVVGAGHARFVGLKGLTTAALFAHPREGFSISFPRDEACTELGRKIVHGEGRTVGGGEEGAAPRGRPITKIGGL